MKVFISSKWSKNMLRSKEEILGKRWKLAVKISATVREKPKSLASRIENKEKRFVLFFSVIRENISRTSISSGRLGDLRTVTHCASSFYLWLINVISDVALKKTDHLKGWAGLPCESKKASWDNVQCLYALQISREGLQKNLVHSSGFLNTKGGETVWLYRVNSRPKSFI